MDEWINVNDDDLKWLSEGISNSLEKEHDVMFGVIEDGRLQANIDQPTKGTLGACRFFMTQELPGGGDQLLLIGMNPSYARTFTGTTGGLKPESDPTAQLVFKWLFDTGKSDVYASLRPLGRITMINLVPTVDPDSKNNAETLEALNCRPYLKAMLQLLLQDFVTKFEGKTHIIRMWGSESGDNSWKTEFSQCIHAQRGEAVSLATHHSVWDFKLPQPDYPPHALRFQYIKGRTPAGLIDRTRRG